MPDVCDQSDATIQTQLDAGLSRVPRPPTQPFRGAECLDCGDKLPSERARLGYCVCVDCAAAEERRERLFRSWAE